VTSQNEKQPNKDNMQELLSLIITESPNQFRALCYVVYKIVEHNPSVTETKVVWNLGYMYGLNEPLAKQVVLALKHKEMLNGLKTWNTGKACHLRALPGYKVTCHSIELALPVLKTFVPPSILTAEKKNANETL
jgi:hypothetical protein